MVCIRSRSRGMECTCAGHGVGMSAAPVGVAIIDLDNTLVRGSALFHFGAHLVRSRRLAARHLLRFVVAETAYAWAHRETAELPVEVAQRALGVVKGLRHSDVVGWADAFADTRLRRHLNTDMVLALEDLKKAGYATYLATASPQELADAVARAVGMDGAIGTRAEVIGGRYTGDLAGPIVHGVVKARLVRAMLDKEGFDADGAFAFSDSVTDLPLLTLVGRPVATNPDRELRRIARANGWRIVSERDTSSDALARAQVLFPHPY